GCGDDAGRLVQQVVDEAGPHTVLGAVDLDGVGLGVDAATEHGHLAVHPDPPALDEVFADATAAYARLGQHLLQADALVRVALGPLVGALSGHGSVVLARRVEVGLAGGDR